MISAFTTKFRGASEERTPTLSELCGDAAKHVAEARIALFSEAVDTDVADLIRHLKDRPTDTATA